MKICTFNYVGFENTLCIALNNHFKHIKSSRKQIPHVLYIQSATLNHQ